MFQKMLHTRVLQTNNRGNGVGNGVGVGGLPHLLSFAQHSNYLFLRLLHLAPSHSSSDFVF